MNKKQLIDAVALKGEMSKKDAEIAVDTVFGCVENALENQDDVRLVGFGTFSVKNRAERTGRNPATKEEILIPAKKAPAFKPGKELKERVNK